MLLTLLFYNYACECTRSQIVFDIKAFCVIAIQYIRECTRGPSTIYPKRSKAQRLAFFVDDTTSTAYLRTEVGLR